MKTVKTTVTETDALGNTKVTETIMEGGKDFNFEPAKDLAVKGVEVVVDATTKALRGLGRFLTKAGETLQK